MERMRTSDSSSQMTIISQGFAMVEPFWFVSVHGGSVQQYKCVSPSLIAIRYLLIVI